MYREDNCYFKHLFRVNISTPSINEKDHFFPLTGLKSKHSITAKKPVDIYDKYQTSAGKERPILVGLENSSMFIIIDLDRIPCS